MALVSTFIYSTWDVQQGLEIRCFWFQKKTVQLKTVLCEVYNYVLKEIFLQKTVYLQGFAQNPCFMRLHLCTNGDLYSLFSRVLEAGKEVLKQEKEVLKQEKEVLKQKKDILKQERMF